MALRVPITISYASYHHYYYHYRIPFSTNNNNNNNNINNNILFLSLPAVLLHEMLAVLQGGVKSAVVALCELWWHKELEAQDLLMTNVLTYLLEAAIRKGGQVRRGKKGEVKR